MISVIVNTYNEANYLDECLRHVSWADEIIVVDMHSSDRSVEIARRYTEKIYFHERTISVLYARNFSLAKATGDWILVVDPDEVVPAGLAAKLQEIAQSHPPYSAVNIPFQLFFLKKPLAHAYPVDHKPRFFKKGCVDFPARVHAHPVIQGSVYSLPKSAEFTVLHYVSDTVFQYVEKMNRYTSDEALHMHKDDGIVFRKWHLIQKPLAEFHNRYCVRRGYRDGIEGFIFSVLMALYRFITYVKLMELEKI